MFLVDVHGNLETTHKCRETREQRNLSRDFLHPAALVVEPTPCSLLRGAPVTGQVQGVP
jgi:hypothetical protein